MEAGMVVVDVDDASVLRELHHILNNLDKGNRVTLLRGIGYAMRTSTLQKFRDERGPDGKWEPLAPATIANRRDVRAAAGAVRKRKGAAAKQRARQRLASAAGAVKILQDRGDLKGSIHAVADSEAVDIGTPMLYGVFHQKGAPRANIPARPFLYIDISDHDRIESLALNYLARCL